MHEGHRERLIKKLLSGNELYEHELIEILLFYSIPRKNVNEIAHNIVDKFGDMRRIFCANPEEYTQIKGIGERTAKYFVTLGKCMQFCMNTNSDMPQEFSYRRCKGTLISMFESFMEENFIAFYLNAANKIISRKIFSSHSDNHAEVDIGELIKGAFFSYPRTAVVCHNHLSGDPTPSAADDRATKQMVLALALHNVMLTDHIIVAGDQTFSYRKSNRLDGLFDQLYSLSGE